ncbi:IS3 family transposase [Streptomyces sp. Wb2n-11]|uniref:IS3 family transposase n=1 Tax=Streptomyces sp. Wb2n-11 TaxID=1030533 RepID=UPI000B88CA2F
MVDEIREIHAEHRGNHGALRVHAELRGFGHTVNRKRAAPLMRSNGIVGRHLRKKEAHHHRGPSRPAGAGPGPAGLHRGQAAACSGRPGEGRCVRVGRVHLLPADLSASLCRSQCAVERAAPG